MDFGVFIGLQDVAAVAIAVIIGAAIVFKAFYNRSQDDHCCVEESTN